jgi:hypothetical protein
MTEISYRVIPKGKLGFDVEIERPDGRRQIVPGFLSEHEAEAWIVQAKRMIRDANPLTPVPPRKPGATANQSPIVPPLPVAPEPLAASDTPIRAVSSRSRRKPEAEGFSTVG